MPDALFAESILASRSQDDVRSDLRTPKPPRIQTAPLLRVRPPSKDQAMTNSQAQYLNHRRAQTTLAFRRSNTPPPYSYGSSVSLDPASLSPVPDSEAIAEIQKVITAKDEGDTRWQVIEASIAHGRQSQSSIEMQFSNDEEADHGAGNEDAAEDTAGADFDALLQNLEESGFVRPSGVTEDNGAQRGRSEERLSLRQGTKNNSPEMVKLWPGLVLQTAAGDGSELF